MNQPPVRLTYRLLSYLVSALLAGQPVVPAFGAGITPQEGAQMDRAANGVPVVNIATPNGAGISHNQFKDYNVGKEGLILNNATDKLNQTQLGGLINGNANLSAGKEAKGIINEVTGGNRSQLQGYTEVAGKAANVMVANPYGITCNGCGFINTLQVTLTTGKPVLDASGNLQALEVKKGSITLEGQGIDASSSDALSIIARATEVNAAIHAKDLKIIAGSNRMNADGSVQALQGEDTVPTVAVDTGALGGMYANRIHLVSTEKGVGVNLGNLNARQGDITLDASGKLTLHNSLASGSLHARSQDMTLTGDHKAGGSIALNSERDLVLNSGSLNGNGDIVLQAGGMLAHSQEKLTAGRNVSLTADRVLVDTTSHADAARDITVNAGHSVINQGRITAGQHLAIRADSLNHSGELIAGHALNLQATHQTLNGAVNTTGEITVNGQSITTGDAAQIQGQSLNISAEQVILQGTQAAKEELKVTARNTLNHRGQSSATTVIFDAPQFMNSGVVLATSQATQSQQLTNSGLLQGNTRLDITTQSLDNSLNGTLYSAENLSLAMENTHNSGLIISDKDLTLSGSRIHNDKGRVFSGEAIQAELTSLSGTGSFPALGNLTLTLIRSFTIEGVIAAGKQLVISSQGDITNTGTLQGDGITLTATGQLTSDGRLTAGSGITSLSGSQIVMNASGSLQAGGDVNLNSQGNIILDGLTGTAGDLVLNAAGAIINTALLYAGNNLSLFADSIRNLHGDILAGNNLWMQKEAGGAANTEVINTSGNIETTHGDITINTRHLLNTRDGLTSSSVTTLNPSSVAGLGNATMMVPLSQLPETSYYAVLTPEWERCTGVANTHCVIVPGYTRYYMKPEFATQYFAARQTLTSVFADGGSAGICSGGNLTINADQLDNHASDLLSGANISLSGTTLSNQSWQAGTDTTYWVYQSNGNSTDNSSKAIGFTLEGKTTRSEPGEYYRAVIQAAGSIRTNFTGDISNTSTTDHAGGISNTLVAPSLNTPSTQSISAWIPDDIDHHYPLPSGRNGYFVTSTDPDSPYLITVNPKLDGLGQPDPSLFADLYRLLGMRPGTAPYENRSQYTDVNQFLGSAYLLGRLSLNPDKNYRFLGDAAFDNRYVSNVVLNRTGARYINGLGSDLEQMRYLMDNAAQAQNGLGLKLGVALSAGQIAALDHSILWCETATINGQTVMVPKVYLSPKDVTVQSGSVISGNNVQLAGGNVTNSGSSLLAQNGLSIDSSNSLSNLNAGLIKAGGALDLSAQGDINNIGSSISGKTVQLESTGGSINNITQKQQWSVSSGDRRGRVQISGTDVGQTASITATDGLSMAAAKDINITGAKVTAGGDLAMGAGNSINIAANQVSESNSQSGFRSKQDTSSLSTTNQGSSITAGGNAVMQAGNDLNVTASAIDAGKTAQLVADNNLNLNAAGNGKTSRTGGSESHQSSTDRTTVSAGDNVTLVAGRDVTSQAAGIAAEGNVGIQAGRDVNLLAEETVTGSSSRAKKKTVIDESVRQQGTEIASGGNSVIIAGRDVNSQAAQVTASGDIGVAAGRDVNLTTATESDYHFREETKTKKGFLSKKTTHTIEEDSATREVGTLLSGDNVTVQAGNNLLVKGSSVVGDNTVGLDAGNNVDIVAATNTDSSWRFKEEKKSGLMGTGGIGITIGSSKTTHDLREAGTTQSQSFSTVGSTGGNVVIAAGNQTHIGGADLIAGKDMSLSGSSVLIYPGHDKRSRDEIFEQKKSGLTIALSGAVGGAINNAVNSAQDAKEESDGRLAALQATKSVLSGVQVGQAVALDAADAGNTENPSTNAIGISASLTTQKSKFEQHVRSDGISGSTLNAGNNLSITANGKKGDGDIVIAGSQLKAGSDTLLDAKNDVILSGAANTQQTTGKNSSSGGGVGIGIGVGSGGWGISVFANGNSAHGKEKGNGTDWTETTIDSGKTVTIKSGNDTVLDGALVNGNKIVADVGHDLLMTSQQDNNDYDSKQTSVAGGGSFTFGSMSGSAYMSVNQDKMKSRFDSVAEQTGLYTGDGGFDITVGNHTQLDGAVIASTATADKNKLDTGTLGFNDIHNEADFKTQHTGGAFNTGGNIAGQFASNAANALLAGGGNKGHTEGTTQAAVADGTITIRDKDNQKQDVADLSRDTEHANDSISPIFDKEKEQKRLQEIQLIGEVGAQAADVARTQGDLVGRKAAKDPASLEEARQQLAKEGKPVTDAAVAERAYNNASSMYGTGGAVQRGLQAVTGALTALAGGGNLAGALAAASAPELANIIGHRSGLSDDEALIAHAVLGGVVASLQGNSAATGAAGALTGELAARTIKEQLFPGKSNSELSESDKQLISNLATLASGLAGNMASGNSAGTTTAAQAGKNAVENNALGNVLAAANANKPGTTEKWQEEQQAAIKDACSGNTPVSCQMAVAAMGTVMSGGVLPEAMVISGIVSAGAVGGVDYAMTGTVDPKNVMAAYWVGAFTRNTGLEATIAINAAGGATTSYLDGKNPWIGGLVSGLTGGVAYGIGNKVVEPAMDEMFNPVWKNLGWDNVGMGISKPVQPSLWPSVAGATSGTSGGEYISNKVNDKIDEVRNNKGGKDK